MAKRQTANGVIYKGKYITFRREDRSRWRACTEWTSGQDIIKLCSYAHGGKGAKATALAEIKNKIDHAVEVQLAQSPVRRI
jgi:hypothetical protein